MEKSQEEINEALPIEIELKNDIAAKQEKLSVKSFEDAIYEMKGRKLLKFIKNTFQHDKKSTHINHEEIFDILVNLDEVAIEYGIAKMKFIEEENDTKSFPYIISIVVVAILPNYKTLLDIIGGGENSSVIPMLVFVIFFLILITIVTSYSNKNSQKAIYFKSLLESAKEIKNNRKKNHK